MNGNESGPGEICELPKSQKLPKIAGIEEENRASREILQAVGIPHPLRGIRDCRKRLRGIGISEKLCGSRIERGSEQCKLTGMVGRTVSILLGMLVCWLLNFVQLGVAFVLLATSEKALPAIYVLAGAIGLVQVGYVVPLFRLLWRKGQRDIAAGLVAGAVVTLVVN